VHRIKDKALSTLYDLIKTAIERKFSAEECKFIDVDDFGIKIRASKVRIAYVDYEGPVLFKVSTGTGNKVY
jgi:hypothetical protein